MLTKVMEGQVDYNKYLDQLIEVGEEADIDAHRIELLFKAYFPEIDELRERVSEMLSDHNSVIHAHKKAYKNGERGEDFIGAFTFTQIEFDKACKAVKEALIVELRKIDG